MMAVALWGCVCVIVACDLPSGFPKSKKINGGKLDSLNEGMTNFTAVTRFATVGKRSATRLTTALLSNGY